MASPFSSLKHRNYRLYWFGQMVSLIGTWMQTTGQAWLVLILTDSPFLLGLIGALQFAPVLIFGLVAGVVADRVPKRTMLIVTQTSLMILAFVLAALTLSGHVRYWHIAILAALLGITNAFDGPTRQAFVVEMVGKEDLMNAIALNSSVFNVARIVGPAVSGFVTKVYGPGWAFFINGVSFLAVIAALFAMRVDLPKRFEAVHRSVAADVREGLGYIGRTPQVLTVILLLGLISTFALNFNVFVPLLAKNVLHGDAGLYGYLMSAMGLGALIGAVGLAFISGRGPQRQLLVGGAVLLCVAEIGAAFIRHSGLAAVVLAIAGLATIVFTATSNTTVQVTVPDRLRGRVMSVYFMVFAGVSPFGALFAGTLAEKYGTPTAMFVGGLTALLSAAGVWLWSQRAAGRNGTAKPGQA
ncbi:MAG: MFS transporter [Bacillota bacterium]